MNNEDKLFDLITKMYAEMQEGFKGIDERFTSVDEKFTGIDERFTNIDEKFIGIDEKFSGVIERLDKIDNRVTIIGQEHGKKLDLLFDGYKQNSEILERIEKEVSKHEEIILRRVK